MTERFIYLAGPNTPMGGGMFKVTEYLMQMQDRPVLRLLETRGGGRAVWSPFYLLRAILAIVLGRLTGKLAGVHVNIAERLSVVRKGLLMLACRALGVPVVLHVHAGKLEAIYRSQSALGRALVRWVFSLPDECIALGPKARTFVVNGLRVPADKVHIVSNGVPEPACTRQASERTGHRVLFVGNLSEHKGVSDLLLALAHPALAGLPLHLKLAGGGDIDFYARKAAALQVQDKVEFLGWSSKPQVEALMAEADVLVLPSHYEVLPLVVLEAFAQRVAVVCTAVGEMASLFTHERDAYFVTPEDPASIALGLARVLTDRDLRERLERGGRAAYDAQFSLSHFAAAVGSIHQRVFGLSAMESARAQGRDEAIIPPTISTNPTA
jgi:glycosyltransferase involved in cell wall biosynthesis